MTETEQVTMLGGGTVTVRAHRSKEREDITFQLEMTKNRDRTTMWLTKQEARDIAEALNNEADWLDQMDACA